MNYSKNIFAHVYQDDSVEFEVRADTTGTADVHIGRDVFYLTLLQFNQLRAAVNAFDVTTVKRGA